MVKQCCLFHCSDSIVDVNYLLTECEDLYDSVGHVTPADVIMTSHSVNVNSLIQCFTQSDCVTSAEQLLQGYCYFHHCY